MAQSPKINDEFSSNSLVSPAYRKIPMFIKKHKGITGFFRFHFFFLDFFLKVNKNSV